MILIDSNVLVGLADARDQLFDRATKDLPRLMGEKFYVPQSVLTESWHFLPLQHLRIRLIEILDDLEAQPTEPEFELEWPALFDWLRKYADHEPDWADATLVLLTSLEDRFRVWTYDREFRTIWRKPDGSGISLAVY